MGKDLRGKESGESVLRKASRDIEPSLLQMRQSASWKIREQKTQN